MNWLESRQQPLLDAGIPILNWRYQAEALIEPELGAFERGWYR
ncbi:hypothetical protein ACFPT7_15680 [Acidicapsa dinghuensis]|uniref:Uncharacterized protein n=1 Tax=Acidicapsa dinghuensis TaxID=2218256 RepID=A0ABW1EI24_9BACT|nr:hypothetical protein [Acidicapsa dinghuensis]